MTFLSRLLILALVAGSLLFGNSPTMATTSYHIGNSLTFDSQPEAMEAFAASRGLDHQVGFHIRTSSSLRNILDNPTDVSIEPNEFGAYTQALPNNAWDIVTIQPHPSNSPYTTLGEDIDSIMSFINLTRTNPANANTNFYIYQAWPQRGTATYQAQWTAPSPNELDSQMVRRREYYNNLIERVRAETDANVYMIPVGEVLFELDVRMRAGEIPGFTNINQMYRDALHLSYGAGRFVAGATTFATILGQYPTGLDIPADFYGGPSTLTQIQKDAILETIRDVLDKHPYSGVTMPAPLKADFDGNLSVDEQDLLVWQRSLGITNPYDPDENGKVTGRDFLRWQRDYHAERSEAEQIRFDILDTNGDGRIDTADLQHWHDSYGLNAAADIDGDGDTDGRDFLMLQRTASTNLADSDGDFLVNNFELEQWQQSYGFDAVADANKDGVVDQADYEVWETENGLSWNYPYAMTAPPLASQLTDMQNLAIPEPNSLILTVIWFLAPFLRWRLP